VSACHKNGECAVRWCGSMTYEICLYSVVVWQHGFGIVCDLFGAVQRFICTVCVLGGGVAALYNYGMYIVCLCGSMS